MTDPKHNAAPPGAIHLDQRADVTVCEVNPHACCRPEVFDGLSCVDIEPLQHPAEVVMLQVGTIRDYEGKLTKAIWYINRGMVAEAVTLMAEVRDNLGLDAGGDDGSH